ncbi:MAG TPA: YdcF family protein [Syntrophomonadaceae bacterium]|nr:YdcF family protein [Syntrophomonadaceae bacterium]
MIRSLENRYHPPSALNCDVLVMLTGGATLDTPDVDGLGHLSGATSSRLLTAARLQKRTNLPIILSGGQFNGFSGNESQIAKRYLIGLGIPEENIIIEDAGLNTTQSALRTKQILEQKGYKKPILITSAFHMYRSVLNFDNIGVKVLPFPCDYEYNTKPSLAVSEFFPRSFDSVWTALHEYLGIFVESI